MRNVYILHGNDGKHLVKVVHRINHMFCRWNYHYAHVYTQATPTSRWRIFETVHGATRREITKAEFEASDIAIRAERDGLDYLRRNAGNR